VEIHAQELHAPMVHLLFSLDVVVTIVIFKQQELKITPTPWLAFLPSIQSMVALVAILAFLFDPMVEIYIDVICCRGLRWMLHNTLHGCFFPLEDYNICIFFFIKLK
jgi:hypothetical protein